MTAALSMTFDFSLILYYLVFFFGWKLYFVGWVWNWGHLICANILFGGIIGAGLEAYVNMHLGPWALELVFNQPGTVGKQYNEKRT